MNTNNAIQKDVKLSAIVNMYIDESRQTSKEFRRLWALAFRGLQDIGIDVSWSPKTTSIEVNDNKTVNIPTDFLDWVRIGVLNSSGELATLKVNESLTTLRDINSTRLSDIQSEVTTEYDPLRFPAILDLFGDNSPTKYFGLGSGLIQAGECVFDKTNNVFVLDTQFNYERVVLQYMSMPIMDSDYTIDFKCQEALIAWLRWKDIQSMPSSRMVNISEKNMRQVEYSKQKNLSRKRMKPFRMQVAEQYIREAQRLSVKG